MVEETDQEFEQEMLQYVREALQESETRFQRLLMESFDEINNLIRGLSLPQIENFKQKFNLVEADAEEVAENLEHKIELTKEETVMEYLEDRVDTEEVAENLEQKIELPEEETVMEYLEDRVQLPEMKTPAEIVVATDYGYLQVPMHGFVVPALVSVLVEDSARQDELGTNAEQVSIQESEYVVHNCDNSLRQRNMRSSSVQENETIVHNGGDLVVRRKASGDLVKVKVRKKKRKVKFIQQKLTKMARQIIVSTDVVKKNEHHIMETDKLMKVVLEQQNSLAQQVPSKDGIGSTLFPEVTTGITVCLFTIAVAIEWYEIKAIKEIERKMKQKLIISTFIMATVFAIVYWIGLPFLFTSNNDEVQKVVGNGKLFLCVRIGTATNVIIGFALGCKSIVIPNLALTSNIFVCFSFAAMYGISVAAVLIFNTIAFGLVIGAYGSHGDIVMGIAEMAEISHCNGEWSSAIDTIRTTTTTIGNGIAMESIILMFLTLFDAFVSQATTLMVLSGLIVGAFLNRFSAITMTVKSMTSAALKMIEKRCISVGVPPLYKGDKGKQVHNRYDVAQLKKHSNLFPSNVLYKIQMFKDWREMMLGQPWETPWIHIKKMVEATANKGCSTEVYIPQSFLEDKES